VTFTKCVCVVLLAALGVMVVQPAPAEALEPMLISLIARRGRGGGPHRGPHHRQHV